MEARPPERHRPQQHSRLATASTLRVLQVRSSPMRPPPGLSLPDSAGLGSDSRNQSEFFGASRWPSALCVGPRADHADRGPDAGPKWLREEVGWFGLLPFAFFLSFFLSLSLPLSFWFFLCLCLSFWLSLFHPEAEEAQGGCKLAMLDLSYRVTRTRQSVVWSAAAWDLWLELSD